MQFNHAYSKHFSTNSRVKQGYVLALILFRILFSHLTNPLKAFILIHELMTNFWILQNWGPKQKFEPHETWICQWSHCGGTHTGGISVTNFSFLSGLQRVLDNLLEKENMTGPPATKKTNVMGPPARMLSTILIDELKLDGIHLLCYLGSRIKVDLSLEKEMK